MKRNQTKTLVLSALETLEEATYWDLQRFINQESNLDLSENAIKKCLGRCYKWGLVKRRSAHYQLSQKGRQRLQWLLQQKHNRLLEEGG